MRHREYDVEFNGQTGEDNKVYVTKRPNIPTPKRNYREYNIPGRDGVEYEDEGTVDDIEIPVEFNFLEKPENWFNALRRARAWLMKTGKLSLSDDMDFFYLVKKVEIDTAERTCMEIGKFTATFTCSGYHYFKTGEIKYKKLTDNPGDASHPIYEITGTGECTLTVNGKTMTAAVIDNINIDTDKQIAFRNDKKRMNTSVSGWYEDLYLKTGKNDISITEGFDLTIIPNWRCV